MDRREFIIGGSSIVVGGSIGFGSGMAFDELVSSEGSSSSGDGSNGGSDVDSNESDGSLDLVSKNRPTLGSSDAPVKMVYWSDYQCPFCYRFERKSLPSIIDRFVNSGDVELVVKPLNVFGKDSYLSALGSHCVFELSESVDDWFVWHKRMYEIFQEGGGRNNGWASASNQGEYASEFGFVRGDKLTACVEDRKYRDRIQVDREEASKNGFEGTPFFVLYNVDSGESTTITGAQPLSRFEDEINSLLG